MRAPAANRSVLAVAALLVVFVAAWAALMSVKLSTNATDVPRYHTYGEAMRHGNVPYRDFPVEYPPGALVTFVVPALAASGLRGYRIAFEILMAAIGCGVLVSLSLAAARLGHGVLAPTAFAGTATLALGPITLGHFDLWPALLVEAALAALLWERRSTAAAMLGLAVAAKVYPFVLLPIGAALVWRRHGQRAATIWTGTAVGAAACCFVPFLLLAPEGVVSSVVNQANRPLQLESSAAAALLALHQLVSLPIGVAFSHSSANLGGWTAGTAAAATVVFEIAALLSVWTLFARGPQDGRRLAGAATAAVLAFVALGKVFSPQFLLWLLPLAPLLGGIAGVGASAVLSLAVVLTRSYFPGRWSNLIRFEALPTWLLVARDLVLLGLLVALLAASAGLQVTSGGRLRPTGKRS